jgi:hypothetical protein
MATMRTTRHSTIVGLTLCLFALFAITDPAVGKENKKLLRDSPDKKGQPSSIQAFGTKDSDSSFTWDQMQTGTARIAVWNDSASDQGVKLHGNNLVLLSPTPDVAPIASIAITIIPDSATIHPHDSASFRITLNSSSPNFGGSGAYGGIVEIDSEKPVKDPVFRKIQITVPPPRPALSKISFTAWRYFPFVSGGRANGEIPLTGNIEKPAIPKVVGYLQSDRGWGALRWTEIKQHREKQAQSLAVLEFDDLPAAGRYDGGINLLGIEEKDQQASISVTSKDIVIWPLAVIAGGIWIGWWAKRYVGVLRLTWSLRKLEAELGLAFRTSQEKFADLSVGKPYASYSIGSDLTIQRVAIRNQLDGLEGSSASLIEGTQQYKDSVSAIQQVQAVIAQWPDVASAASSLDEAISSANTTIEPNATVPPGGYVGTPFVLKNVQQLLVGKPIACAEIPQLLKNLLDSTALVRKWLEANGNAITVSMNYGTLVGELTTPTASQQSILDEIKDKLIAVWTHLWRGVSPDDFSTGPGSDLDAAIQNIEQLKPSRPIKSAFAPPQDTLTSVTPATTHYATLSQVAVEAYTLNLPPNDTQRAEFLRRAIARSDTASVILASVIAVLTGLNSNYWGKPFGSLQDYAVLFLWAAGTKVGVDIIAAVTDKFISATSATQ